MGRRDWSFDGRQRITFVGAILKLIGHLIGTGVIFVTFISVGWGISFFIHWLNEIHHLPVEMFDFVETFELWLTYADALLCSFMVLASAKKFLAELGEMR